MSEITDGAARPRLGLGELVGRAWAMIAGSLPRLWPVWLLLSVLYGVGYHLQIALRFAAGTSISPSSTAFTLIVAALGSILTAVEVRILLNRQKPWGRLDRGIAVWVSLSVAINLALLLATSAVAALLSPSLSIYAGWVAWLLRLILLPVWLKLMLWPIGLVVGDASVTLRRSWRLMRGAVWPTLWATIIVGALPFVVGLVFSNRFFYQRDLLDLLVSSAMLAAFSLVTQAVGAAVYRLRLVDTASLGDIFD